MALCKRRTDTSRLDAVGGFLASTATATLNFHRPWVGGSTHVTESGYGFSTRNKMLSTGYPTINTCLHFTVPTSQERIVDLQIFFFDGQYVLHLRYCIFYLTIIYCFAIYFNWSYKNLCLTVSTYYIFKTVYFTSQQYIVLRSNLVDPLKFYVWHSVRNTSPNSVFYLTTIYCLVMQFNVLSFFSVILTVMENNYETFYCCVKQFETVQIEIGLSENGEKSFDFFSGQKSIMPIVEIVFPQYTCSIAPFQITLGGAKHFCKLLSSITKTRPKHS